MNKVPAAIFHLIRDQGVLRKAIAFFGLVTILLTASCGPTPSDSTEISVPPLSEIAEFDESGIQVLPDGVNAQENPGAKADSAKTEPSIPASDLKTKPPVQAPSTTPSKGTSDTTGPVDEGTRALVERLNANYLWAMMPTYVDIYKDENGQVHEHFKVLSGDSQELKVLLAKMRDDLVVRGSNGEHFQFEIKEQGACGNEKKEASTKSCDTTAPICLSLESINVPQADLEQALRPLVMREFARQHCADEATAKQVEKYYNLPAIKNFKTTSRVASILNRVRLNLLYLQAALTTGLTPHAGKYAQKIDSKEEICNMIAQGAAQALVLQDQVISSGFVQDPKNAVKAPRIVLTETLKSMSTFCDGTSLDRPALLPPLEQAIKSYDELAQEFSQKSGMIVIDFSKHLWAHEN